MKSHQHNISFFLFLPLFSVDQTLVALLRLKQKATSELSVLVSQLNNLQSRGLHFCLPRCVILGWPDRLLGKFCSGLPGRLNPLTVLLILICLISLPNLYVCWMTHPFRNALEACCNPPPPKKVTKMKPILLLLIHGFGLPLLKCKQSWASLRIHYWTPWSQGHLLLLLRKWVDRVWSKAQLDVVSGRVCVQILQHVV